MQYITQCPNYSSVITTPFRKDNYLLSQIVKEQPIDTSEEAPSNIASPRHWLLFPRSPNAPVPRNHRFRRCFATTVLVEPTGIEPVTSCLQSRRSPS